MEIIKRTVVILLLLDFVAGQKMRLQDLKALTLEHNRFASTRRYPHPIPQLVCVGGSAGCKSYTPKTVRCINEGWDGISTQWECKADMPEKYRFGSISVVCEGFDFPEDEFILKGSCSLEYQIDFVVTQDSRTEQGTWYPKREYGQHEITWSSVIFVVVVLSILGYFIYWVFIADHVAPRQFERDAAPASPRASAYSSERVHRMDRKDSGDASQKRTATAYGGTKRR